MADLDTRVRRRARRVTLKLLLRYRDRDAITAEDFDWLCADVAGMIFKILPIYADLKDPVRAAFRFYEDYTAETIEAELRQRFCAETTPPPN